MTEAMMMDYIKLLVKERDALKADLYKKGRIIDSAVTLVKHLKYCPNYLKELKGEWIHSFEREFGEEV